MDYDIESDDDTDDKEEIEEQRKVAEQRIEALAKKFAGKKGEVCSPFPFSFVILDLRMFTDDGLGMG